MARYAQAGRAEGASLFLRCQPGCGNGRLDALQNRRRSRLASRLRPRRGSTLQERRKSRYCSGRPLRPGVHAPSARAMRASVSSSVARAAEVEPHEARRAEGRAIREPDAGGLEEGRRVGDPAPPSSRGSRPGQVGRFGARRRQAGHRRDSLQHTLAVAAQVIQQRPPPGIAVAVGGLRRDHAEHVLHAARCRAWRGGKRRRSAGRE